MVVRGGSRTGLRARFRWRGYAWPRPQLRCVLVWHRKAWSEPVKSDVIDRMIAKWSAETICETLAPYLTAHRLERIEHVLNHRLSSVAAICEDTYDPHNAVAAVRTSEALGLSEFHAVSGPDHFRLAPGITRGCDRWLTMYRWSTPQLCVSALRQRGFKIYVTAPEADRDLETIDVSAPVAVIFGNEHAGVTADAEALCDGAIKIPMFGFTESFNLSVSVALAMSRIAARRRLFVGATGDLNPQQKMQFRARWMALKVRSVNDIVERLLQDS
jgi:tRNA (guanosine-2'-O-)-methyltransferase